MYVYSASDLFPGVRTWQGAKKFCTGWHPQGVIVGLQIGWCVDEVVGKIACVSVGYDLVATTAQITPRILSLQQRFAAAVLGPAVFFGVSQSLCTYGMEQGGWFNLFKVHRSLHHALMRDTCANSV